MMAFKQSILYNILIDPWNTHEEHKHTYNMNFVNNLQRLRIWIYSLPREVTAVKYICR